VFGRVTDAAGNGVSRAAVRLDLGSRELTADEEGRFTVDVSADETLGDELVVRASAPGFANGAVRIPAVSVSGKLRVTLILHEVAVDQIVSEPEQGIDASTDGARFVVAPNVLPNRALRVEFSPLDPSTRDVAAFPGQDFLAVGRFAPIGLALLESIGLAEVRLTDVDSGEPITNLGAPAMIELRLPETQQGLFGVGDTIPWWSFDEESSRWFQEGDAEVFLGPDGKKWARADAFHFTWWNVDQPITSHTCFKARLVRLADGSLLTGIEALAEGITYAGQSPARVDGFATADGQTSCFTVKRSAVTVERVRLSVAVGGRRLYLVSRGGGAYGLTPDPAQATSFDAPLADASCVFNQNTASCGDFGTLRLDLNQPPDVVLTANRARVCASSRTIVLAALATDPEGDALTYDWSASAGTIAGTGSTASWTVPAALGTYTARVDVRDAHGATTRRTIDVETADNCCPIIDELLVPAVVDPRITPTVQLDVDASDGDAAPHPLGYVWKIGRERLAGPTATWTARGCGPTEVQLLVSDGECTTIGKASIDVRNACPVFDSVTTDPELVACSDPRTTLSAVVTDADGDPVTLTWDAQEGQVDPAAGSSTDWSSTPGDATDRVRVTASDPFGGTAATDVFIVPDNDPPAAQLTSSATSVAPGGIVSLAVNATDDGAVQSFDWSANGGTFQVAPDGQTAEWTAPPEFGQYFVGVRVTDDCEASVNRFLTILVVAAPPPPPGPGEPCTVALQPIPATGSAPLEVTLLAPTQGLTFGLFGNFQFDSDDGGFIPSRGYFARHRYDTPGTYHPSVTAADFSSPETCTAQTTVVVTPNQAPTFVGCSGPVTLPEETSGTFLADVSDPDGDPITLQWAEAAGSPVGAAIGRDEAALTWLAPRVTGNTPVVLRVTASDDKGGATTCDVALTVTNTRDSASRDLCLGTLRNGDILGAATPCGAAAAADPSDAAAALLRAATAIVMDVAGSTTLLDLPGRFGVVVTGSASDVCTFRATVSRVVPPDAPHGDALLAIAQSEVLPRVDAALTRLDQLGSNLRAFFDPRDLPACLGLSELRPLEIDDGDIQAARAALHAIAGAIHAVAAYGANVDSPGLLNRTVAPRDQFLAEPTLLVQRPGAVAELAAARARADAAVAAFLAAIAAIEGETDDQSDDLLVIDPVDVVAVAQARSVAERTRTALTGVGVFEPALTGLPGDQRLSLGALFAGAVSNLRPLVPPFDAAGNPDACSVPDPTFGGIAPDMTAVLLQTLLDLRCR
jgi:hypothetical protein